MTARKFKVGITADVRDSSGKTIFDPAALAILEDPAIEWSYLQLPDARVSPSIVADYDALCMMRGRVTPDSFVPDAGRLRLIARFGVGYDTIDVPTCTANGVLLAIAPDGVRRPVATTVITFVLALAQRLLIKDRMTRAGRWAERQDTIGMGLTGRVLGAIGMGNIGQDVFRLAAPFGMRHLAFDPFATAEAARALNVTLCDLGTLLREADFVCVMCPLNAETRGMIGARELALMKRSAYLINTARGAIVQEKALVEALANDRIAGAGLDVFEVEPPAPDNPLLKLDSVIVTPHSLCFTEECLTGLARSAFSAATAVARGEVPAHIVNRDALAHAALRHLIAR